jgi:hypothetical protein
MASRLKSLLLAVFLLSASPLTPAFAIPIEVSFTASGFGAGAPTDPVTGVGCLRRGFDHLSDRLVDF